MTVRRKLFGHAGDAGIGLSLSAGPVDTGIVGQLVVVPSQLAVLQIPASNLRNFVDGVFPSLATNRIADCASGYGHRYVAGHDLLLDVPSTVGTHGPLQGLRHAGHILLTDFPTTAGIPIPGFSASGLGQLLERVGIASGWLQINMFDTGIGVFALADGATTLTQAMEGALSMDFGTACQTFGLGTAEIGLAMSTQNPLLLAGGIENVLAGIVSSWETFSVYVDPLDLLGAAGTSAVLGFGIAYGLIGQDPSNATLNAVRSGAVGALYSVSSAFGFGAMAGFIVCRLGMALAQHHNVAAQGRLTVDDNSFRLLVEALCAGNAQVSDFLEKAAPRLLVPTSATTIQSKTAVLPGSPRRLATPSTHIESRPLILDTGRIEIWDQRLRIPDDPPNLSTLYRSAFGIRQDATA